MTLGNRLRKLREERNLMQREVGSVIGLDGTYISKIEHNEKPLNRNHLKVLADFFKIEERELQILWLADKVFRIVEKEEISKQSIKNVLERLG